ncbi:MAG: pyridoxamine 5'-phosphate oxidase family protein [Chloroflexota bacterium]|nr:pyridoxamine 5'-phosphate oxidase family protein [Chloroflexota bacterium]
MGKVFDHITPELHTFIGKQHLFFVATAPLSGAGHVNLSPKGMDCFRILAPNRVAYLDLTGSGNETSAHIAENERITFMFCSFDGTPNIVRLYGRGQTVLPDSREWATLIGGFTLYTGARQIIVADIHRTSTACGYAVPLYDYEGERETLVKYWAAKGADATIDYQREKNSSSIDGLTTPICASSGAAETAAGD